MTGRFQRPPLKLAILLTATVNPGKIPALAISDPADRLRDYCQALNEWIKIPNVDRLVWCDNSGYRGHEVKEILRLAKSKVEVLDATGEEYPSHLGKGYGEMAILRHTLSASRLVRESDLVLKVTGRLRLANAAKLIDRLKRVHDIDVVADLVNGLTWGDSRVVAATPRFFEDHLLPLQEKLDESRHLYFEHALARAIHQAMAEGKRWVPLPVDPGIRGRSGSTGRIYSRNPIRAVMRATARAIFNALMAR